MTAKQRPTYAQQRPIHRCRQNLRLTMLPVFMALFSVSSGCAASDPTTIALHSAIQSGDLASVKSLVEKNVSVETSDSAGRTPLYVAALYGKADIAAYLLAKGASLTNGVSWKSGRLPLHAAAQEGETKLVEMFLDHGADPNAEDRSKKTPLHEAAWGTHSQTVALLLARGAKVGVKDKVGYPPAIPHFPEKIPPDRFARYRQTLEVLIKNGMDVNVRDACWGQTPLIYAAFIGDLDTVKFLQAKGADASIKSRVTEGGTALSVAKREGHKDIVALLENTQRSSEGSHP